MQYKAHHRQLWILLQACKIGIKVERVGFAFVAEVMIAVRSLHLAHGVRGVAQRRDLGAQDHGAQILKRILIIKAAGPQILRGEIEGALLEPARLEYALDRIAEPIMAQIVNAGGNQQQGNLLRGEGARCPGINIVVNRDDADRL